eukprot:TRINITY_DN3624_c0_g1_i1.p1 TRINITY_DN3624_c0_g1~~TRINITY_DN3624_c0_g1_i1.p1  ORF type:complete len:339 (-),score=99.17 TRINITY_DN3624_c0_g1_i1:114-1130(-)
MYAARMANGSMIMSKDHFRRGDRSSTLRGTNISDHMTFKPSGGNKYNSTDGFKSPTIESMDENGSPTSTRNDGVDPLAPELNSFTPLPTHDNPASPTQTRLSKKVGNQGSRLSTATQAPILITQTRSTKSSDAFHNLLGNESFTDDEGEEDELRAAIMVVISDSPRGYHISSAEHTPRALFGVSPTSSPPVITLPPNVVKNQTIAGKGRAGPTGEMKKSRALLQREREREAAQDAENEEEMETESSDEESSSRRGGKKSVSNFATALTLPRNFRRRKKKDSDGGTLKKRTKGPEVGTPKVDVKVENNERMIVWLKQEVRILMAENKELKQKMKDSGIS